MCAAPPRPRDRHRADGWPTLDETRGKIVAVLNEHEEARAEYLEFGGLDPDDRFLFQIGDPADPSPDEVIFSFEGGTDEPPWLVEAVDESTLPEIERLVRSGALVHAATNDPAMVPRLRAAGAHMIASRWPDDVLGPPAAPPSLCNPVTAPPDCRSERVERPRGWPAAVAARRQRQSSSWCSKPITNGRRHAGQRVSQAPGSTGSTQSKWAQATCAGLATGKSRASS
jgi:hypothetical protein